MHDDLILDSSLCNEFDVDVSSQFAQSTKKSAGRTRARIFLSAMMYASAELFFELRILNDFHSL